MKAWISLGHIGVLDKTRGFLKQQCGISSYNSHSGRQVWPSTVQQHEPEMINALDKALGLDQPSDATKQEPRMGKKNLPIKMHQ